MALCFKPVHELYGAEVHGLDLSAPLDEYAIEQIRKGLDEYAVLVFRDQPLTDEQQAAFTRYLGGGKLEGKVKRAESGLKFDLGAELSSAPLKISNVGDKEEILGKNDPRRMSKLGNRLWHNDGCVTNPITRYTILSGRIVPPVRADTQFADTRAAYDALDGWLKEQVRDLFVSYSVFYARNSLGFEIASEEADQLPQAEHKLVQYLSETNREALFLGQHASHVVDWPIPEGRVLLYQLTEHATQPQFIYCPSSGFLGQQAA